jgi:hypothetical protein
MKLVAQKYLKEPSDKHLPKVVEKASSFHSFRPLLSDQVKKTSETLQESFARQKSIRRPTQLFPSK